MQNKIVKIGNIDVANDKPFVLFGRHLSIKLTVLQFILTVVQAWKKV